MSKSAPWARRAGSAVAGIGVCISSFALGTAPAEAETVTPVVQAFSPVVSSTDGGRELTIYGENLFGAVRLTVDGIEVPILDRDLPWGSYVSTVVPPHPAGTAEVVLYLDSAAVSVVPDHSGWEHRAAAENAGPPATQPALAPETTTSSSVVVTTSAGAWEETIGSATSAGATTENAPTEYAGTERTDLDTYPEMTLSYGPLPGDGGLLPVAVGVIEYVQPWTAPLVPESGPPSGGTAVLIDGEFIRNTVFTVCPARLDEGTDDALGMATAKEFADENVVEIEGLQVLFGGLPATDVRLRVRTDPTADDPWDLALLARTPAGAAGPVDVTVNFPDLECGADGQLSAATLAGHTYSFTFTRPGGFTYWDAAPAPTTRASALPATATATPTVETPGPIATPATTTSTGGLAATGPSGRSLPVAALGVFLLGAGIAITRLARPRAH